SDGPPLVRRHAGQGGGGDRPLRAEGCDRRLHLRAAPDARRPRRLRGQGGSRAAGPRRLPHPLRGHDAARPSGSRPAAVSDVRCGHRDEGVRVELKVEVDAAEAGFDARRLGRIGGRLRRYVDDGYLPGWTLVLARHGQVVLVETYGQRDVEAGAPVELDTIFRIYSMTKPITSVAALMLWEEGAFELKDPVQRFVPAFGDTRVWRNGSFLN